MFHRTSILLLCVVYEVYVEGLTCVQHFTAAHAPSFRSPCFSLQKPSVVLATVTACERLKVELVMQRCATFVWKAAKAVIVDWFAGRMYKTHNKWYTQPPIVSNFYSI